MPKIKSFEDLYVFQEGLELGKQIYALTREGPLAKDFGLSSQMQRSAVSIISNIAEGFERETTSELIRSLYVAKGSSGELRAQLLLARAIGFISEKQCESLCAKCKKISAGLYQMIVGLRQQT
jgi:four helix bundle protein